MSAQGYRPEIDGLRAIAVMAVVLFHAQLHILEGGFVGVDVFFVISGYLITKGILKSRREGRFSYIDFYNRRIRRLFPAAFCTILITVALSAVILSPQDAVNASESGIFAALSASNIYFFLQAGYWDGSSLTKPLLHTWTLGVEEQFYLFWPLLISMLFAVLKRWLPIAIVLLFAASLAITTWYTPQNPSAAFFLTPFRIYEFAIGAMCVWGDRFTAARSIIARAAQTLFYLAGLAAILYSVFTYSEDTPFPGYVALLPCLGAAALILAGQPPVLHWLTTNPISTFIGRISYSVYLVHWPIVVFWLVYRPDLTPMDHTALVVLSLLVGAVQYFAVEKPLRHRGKDRPKGAFLRAGLSSLGALTVVGGAAYAVQTNDGFPGRYQQDFQAIASTSLDDYRDGRAELRRAMCQGVRVADRWKCGTLSDDGLNIAVMGDSHGVDGLNTLATAFPDANFILYSASACPPLVELEGVAFGNEQCEAVNAKRFGDIEANAAEFDAIVLSIRTREDRVEAIAATIAWAAEQGPRLIVIGPGPEYSKSALDIALGHGQLDGLETAIRAQTSPGRDALVQAVQQATLAHGGAFVDKYSFLCPDNSCQIFVPGTNMLTIFDDSHMSMDATIWFGGHLQQTQPDLLADP